MLPFSSTFMYFKMFLSWACIAFMMEKVNAFFKKKRKRKERWKSVHGFGDWWKNCQLKDGMGEAGMQFLWIIAEISRALSVLQGAFTNSSLCRLCRLDWTHGHELQHCSTWETFLGGISQLLMGPLLCWEEGSQGSPFQEKPSLQVFTTGFVVGAAQLMYW